MLGKLMSASFDVMKQTQGKNVSAGDRLKMFGNALKSDNTQTNLADGFSLIGNQAKDGFVETGSQMGQELKDLREKAGTQFQALKEKGSELQEAAGNKLNDLKDKGIQYQSAAGKAFTTFQEEIGTKSNTPPVLPPPLPENTNKPSFLNTPDSGMANNGGKIYSTGNGNGALAVIEDKPPVINTPSVAKTEAVSDNGAVKQRDPYSDQMAAFIKDMGTNYDRGEGKAFPDAKKEYSQISQLQQNDKDGIKQHCGVELTGETKSFNFNGGQLIVDSLSDGNPSNPLASLFDGKSHKILNNDNNNRGNSYYAVAVPSNDDQNVVYLRGQNSNGQSWTADVSKVNFGGGMFIMNIYPDSKDGFMSVISQVNGNNEDVKVSCGKLKKHR